MSARTILIAAAMLAAAACASKQTPAALDQARSLYAHLQQTGADQRVSGEMLRAREAIAEAEQAMERGPDEYAEGIAHVALRTTQTAEAADERHTADRAADSLSRVRLARQVEVTQAQRDSLAAAQRLSQQEIDSLRRANEEANARLNEALTQLRSLVVEITNLQQTSRGLVISLSDILFDVNKATLKAGAEANIRRIAAVLQQYPDHQISVEGHTDATGPDDYNLRLSDQRAAAVREALVRGGVDAARITSKGLGETQPVATNDTPAGRQQNRRVEVVVLGAGTLGQGAGTTPP
jgi:outer membrane protein OmpA-like peptidoglycan-associated protein